MGFQDATDALMEAGISLREMAEGLEVSYSAVRQARMPASSSSYRNPPAGWRPKLAEFARSRGAELVELSELIQRESSD